MPHCHQLNPGHGTKCNSGTLRCVFLAGRERWTGVSGLKPVPPFWLGRPSSADSRVSPPLYAAMEHKLILHHNNMFDFWGGRGNYLHYLASSPSWCTYFLYVLEIGLYPKLLGQCQCHISWLVESIGRADRGVSNILFIANTGVWNVIL